MSSAETILALYRDNSDLSVSAIARQVGCSRAYVTRILRRDGDFSPKGSVKPLIEHLARTTALSGRQIAKRVGCSNDYAETVALNVRAENRAGGVDGTVPKFAHHDRYVAAVMAQGGFCAFSEPPGARSPIAVCLPMIWPEAA